MKKYSRIFLTNGLILFVCVCVWCQEWSRDQRLLCVYGSGWCRRMYMEIRSYCVVCVCDIKSACGGQRLSCVCVFMCGCHRVYMEVRGYCVCYMCVCVWCQECIWRSEVIGWVGGWCHRMCMEVRGYWVLGGDVTGCPWRSEDTLQELAPWFHHVDPGD